MASAFNEMSGPPCATAPRPNAPSFGNHGGLALLIDTHAEFSAPRFLHRLVTTLKIPSQACIVLSPLRGSPIDGTHGMIEHMAQPCTTLRRELAAAMKLVGGLSDVVVTHKVERELRMYRRANKGQ